MFLTDNIFNGADVAALAGLGALALAGQRAARRSRPDRISDREYATGGALAAIRADCERSLHLSRSRRGLA